jgi:hypothetical protein
LFDQTSRYYNIEDAKLNVLDAEGNSRTILYKRRRFIPSADGMTALVEHTFIQGDRLDNIAAKYIGDPTQFWQICDANRVMHPEELEAIGRAIKISLPYI